MSSEERSPGADGDTSVESGVAVIAVAPARLPLSSLRTLSRQSQRSLAAAAPIPVIGISLDGILEFAELCWRTTPSPPGPRRSLGSAPAQRNGPMSTQRAARGGARRGGGRGRRWVSPPTRPGGVEGGGNDEKRLSRPLTNR